MKRFAIWFGLALILCTPLVAYAAPEEPAAAATGQIGASLAPHDKALLAGFVAISVAFITGLSILGAGYAVAHVGAAAIGAASEKPEMMGRSLIFVALGEGLAVLGLAVAFVMLFMILMALLK